MRRIFYIVGALTITVMCYVLSTNAASDQRVISFGTKIDANEQITASQQLAKSISNPNSQQWQAKGDQSRTYYFSDGRTTSPYRIYVPTNWDGKSDLPLVMFLHGNGSNENSYLDQNNKQMINLAQQYGFLLVSPLGYNGAYGNFLRLTAPFGQPENASKLMANLTANDELKNELSEKDIINVLELVLNEYPINRSAMFLTGHSMGSGGTWYLGAKYANYWKALAPISGPFVQTTGYPWDNIKSKPLFVSEGLQATQSLNTSRLLSQWLKTNNFKVEYKEVNGDHGGMVRVILPDVFKFFSFNINTSN